MLLCEPEELVGDPTDPTVGCVFGELTGAAGEELDEPEGGPTEPIVGCIFGELAGWAGEEPDAPEGGPTDPVVGCIFGELAGAMEEAPDEPEGEPPEPEPVSVVPTVYSISSMPVHVKPSGASAVTVLKAR